MQIEFLVYHCGCMRNPPAIGILGADDQTIDLIQGNFKFPLEGLESADAKIRGLFIL